MVQTYFQLFINFHLFQQDSMKFWVLNVCPLYYSYYSALRLHSNKPVLSALVMYTFCTKNVQNGTAKLIFLTKNLSKILEFY